MPANWSGPTDTSAARSAAARRAGEMMLADARDRAPELEGELKDSGDVTELEDGAVRVGFSAPYAVKQNFLDFEHPRGGERFFLNNAAEEVGPKLEQILADEIRQAFR